MHIGIDLGGTKVEAVALDAEGLELARHREPTARESYEDTLAQLVCIVQHLERECGQSGTVGIGTPGAISPASGRIKNANSTQLIGHRLDWDLSERLGRPIRIHNDANCFALSEARDGAGRGADIVFGVILGTGTGGGLVIRGELVVGVNAVAGEWGHNPLPWPADDERPGPSCYCGRQGCIECFLSGPGLSRDYLAATGIARCPEQIVSSAGSGEPLALACMQRYEHRLARALAHVINIVDPEVIVLGGGLSKIERLYRHVPRLWGSFVFSDRVDTRLVPPRHGDASGVRGAAHLWF